MANPRDLYQYGLKLGWSPVQTSAILGNMQQESEFNPYAWNPKEGAEGLIQWREDRRSGLHNFANSLGQSPNDPYVQMQFIKNEMGGPEAKAGGIFAKATDLNSANDALKQYIRYGDDSYGTRLNNASGYLKNFGGISMGAPQGASGVVAPGTIMPALDAAPGVPAPATSVATAIPDLGERMGNAIFGNELAGDLRAQFGTKAPADSTGKQGLALLGKSLGGGSDQQAAADREAATITPSGSLQDDLASRMQAGTQLMASLLSKRKAQRGLSMGS